MLAARGLLLRAAKTPRSGVNQLVRSASHLLPWNWSPVCTAPNDQNRLHTRALVLDYFSLRHPFNSPIENPGRRIVVIRPKPDHQRGTGRSLYSAKTYSVLLGTVWIQRQKGQAAKHGLSCCSCGQRDSMGDLPPGPLVSLTPGKSICLGLFSGSSGN